MVLASVVVSVAVTISISVAIVAVFAVIVPTIILRTIEDNAHVLVLLVVVELLQLLNHRPFKQATAHHENHPVGILLEYLCVCHNLNWRTVYENVVELLAECVEHWGEMLAVE